MIKERVKEWTSLDGDIKETVDFWLSLEKKDQ